MPVITERHSYPQAPVYPAAPPPREPQQLQTAPPVTPPAPGQAQPPAPAKSPDAQRLEALANRESRLRREAQRVATERRQTEDLKTQLLQQQEENRRLRGWAQRFYKEPIQVLNEAGVHGDVITQGLLNQPSREAVSIRALTAQVNALIEQNKLLDQKITEGSTQSYEMAKTQVKADAKSLFSTDKSYEACIANQDDAVEAVAELIEQTMEREGRLLSVKEAADEVENYYIEEAAKLAGLGKVQSKLGQTTTPAAGQQTEQRSGPAQSRTLSNRSIPAPSPVSGGTYKDREKARVQRAIQAFEAAATARAQAQ